MNTFPYILALTVTDGSDKVEVGAWPFIIGALPFIVMITLVIMLTLYFLNKKRMEHQQIMAAIERGVPVSALIPLKQKGPNWIINLTSGIGLSLLGLGLIVVVLAATGCKIEDDSGIALFLALVFLTVGITRLIRGILQRKVDKEEKANGNSDTALALDANNGQ
ncbi:MAG: hypothetical protein JW806_10080 [Sedimentisphaerales bacterium]|nr:hypothetical protein [Sedimentisphaerales bacterium]